MLTWPWPRLPHPFSVGSDWVTGRTCVGTNGGRSRRVGEGGRSPRTRTGRPESLNDRELSNGDRHRQSQNDPGGGGESRIIGAAPVGGCRLPPLPNSSTTRSVRQLGARPRGVTTTTRAASLGGWRSRNAFRWLLERAVATAGGNPRVSPRHDRPGHRPLKAETRVRITSSHHCDFVACFVPRYEDNQPVLLMRHSTWLSNLEVV